MGAKPINGGLRADNFLIYNPNQKLELDNTSEVFFQADFVYISSRNFQNWDRIITYFRFKGF